MNCKVYIVGAGPGDPKLITLKGLEVIKQADVIIYDRLISKELLNYSKKNCELIYAGKGPNNHVMEQEEINNTILEKCKEGKIIVRLKGGDPYIYGRGEEECIFSILNGLGCETIPGIPSFIGAATYAGIPLTNRKLSSSIAIMTGKEAKEKERPTVKVEELAKNADTLVILMSASNLKETLRRVANIRGYDEKCAIVINATTENQKTVIGNIGEILEIYDKGVIKNPAVIIIGKTVDMRDKLWKKE
ncbi:MAG: uroporphyrinogen-III C-methyltransferase [Caldisphaera sp.]|nr:uroporphyrinogen-III C-methyltransferase [Caldisphaera sp.]PMP61162.1 MAG: uroporphyrinogen-III C-methyltransferase [Caldisphaera sp.]